MRLTLFLVLSVPLSAADLRVQPGESIQAAIDEAGNGDRVLVEPGVYVETIDFHGKQIAVIGLGGAATTTLDGGGSSPVARFATGEGTATRLQGFTVTGGFASIGAGGIVCSGGATPTVEDCIVRGNRGKFGGGVSGSPVLRRCVILDNTASLTHGGGVYGAPQMEFCVVASNSATSADGGGVYLVGGSATIRDCVVIENGAVFANSSGGGIYIDSTATATIERTVIAANFATGGAFAGLGGGVYAEAPGSRVTSCAVIGNSVSGSSTLGAGLFGPLVVENTIVRDNLGGPDVSNTGSVSYSDVTGGYPGIGNTDVDPLFVDEVGRDLHLLATSPLIDAGDPALLDPDGSRSDIGVFPFQTIYSRTNADRASWSDPAWAEISAVVGGKQVLRILGGASGETYLTLGSTSGTSPGFFVAGITIPLNPDAYFLSTLFEVDTGLLTGALGNLNAAGLGESTFTLPGDEPGTLAGTTFFHATVIVDTTVPELRVTSAAEARIVP